MADGGIRNATCEYCVPTINTSLRPLKSARERERKRACAQILTHTTIAAHTDKRTHAHTHTQQVPRERMSEAEMNASKSVSE